MMDYRASLDYEASLRARYPNLYDIPPERTPSMDSSSTTVEIRRTPHSPNHIIRVTSTSSGARSCSETTGFGPPMEVLIDHAVERHHKDIAQQRINAWRAGR